MCAREITKLLALSPSHRSLTVYVPAISSSLGSLLSGTSTTVGGGRGRGSGGRSLSSAHRAADAPPPLALTHVGGLGAVILHLLDHGLLVDLHGRARLWGLCFPRSSRPGHGYVLKVVRGDVTNDGDVIGGRAKGRRGEQAAATADTPRRQRGLLAAFHRPASALPSGVHTLRACKLVTQACHRGSRWQSRRRVKRRSA